MGSKILCPTLDIMLKKTILALCEVNIKYDLRLEISGSLHVRSDGDKVMTFLIDEEINTPPQGKDLPKPILNVVKPTMLPSFPSLAGLGGGSGATNMSQSQSLSSNASNSTSTTTSNCTQVLPSIAEVLPSSMKKRMMAHLLPGGASETAVTSSGLRSQSSSASVNSADRGRSEQDEGLQDSPDALEVSSASSHYSKSPLQGPDTLGLGMGLGLGLDFHLLQRQNTESETQAMDLSDTSGSDQLHSNVENNNNDTAATAAAADFIKASLGMHLPSVSSVGLGLPSIQGDGGGGNEGQVNHNSSSSSTEIKQEPPDTPPVSFPRLPQLPVAAGLQQTAAMQQMMLAQMMQGTMMGMPGVMATPSATHALSVANASSVTVPTTPTMAVAAKGNKKWQCMFCGILVSSKFYLKSHINAVHTRTRIYPCEMCGKLFYSHGAQRIHKLRNHWVEKRHKCAECGELFVLPFELRQHTKKKKVPTATLR